MIPFDCVHLIVDFAPIKERLIWSMVHRDFKIQTPEWILWARRYKIKDKTRYGVKELCQRHFDAQYLFKQCDRHLWSFHLNEPLCLWSPWTMGKFCKRYSKGCSMTFRNFAFVDFVRNITVQFGLHTKHLTDSVRVPIFKKMIPMVYIYKQKRINKLHISSAFKSFDLARVFVMFRLYNTQLILQPCRLEFLVS